MVKKIAQSSIEFVILVGFVMVAFATFFIVINENLKDKNKNNLNLHVGELALTVQNEINLAYESMDGYNRSFTLPLQIFGKDYTISINQNVATIRTYDNSSSMSVPVRNITGIMTIPHNYIRKENGKIYINQ